MTLSDQMLYAKWRFMVYSKAKRLTNQDIDRFFAEGLIGPTMSPEEVCDKLGISTDFIEGKPVETKKRILCIDFDGVIHSYKSHWIDTSTIPDPPVPGAFKWLEDMVDCFDVCIYSARSRTPAGIAAMQNWMSEHQLPLYVIQKLRFPIQKPKAFMTIDDRCFCFKGVYPTAAEIKNFKPWNR